MNFVYFEAAFLMKIAVKRTKEWENVGSRSGLAMYASRIFNCLLDFSIHNNNVSDNGTTYVVYGGNIINFSNVSRKI